LKLYPEIEAKRGGFYTKYSWGAGWGVGKVPKKLKRKDLVVRL